MSGNNINKELERTVSEENLEEVKALLSRGTDVNHSVVWNWDTMFHVSRREEVTKELLLRGASVYVTNKYDETALDTSITPAQVLEINRDILEPGAYVNENTPLFEVVKEEFKKLLLYIFFIRYFKEDYKKIIDLSPYGEWSNYQELSSYLDDCVCEILKMQTDEIKYNFSLYDIITNNFNPHVLHNNQLAVRLAKTEYSERYPIYGDIILDELKPFFKRADLLHKLSEIQFYTKSDMINQNVEGKIINLDYDSIYNITEYLSNNDLFNFIVAFDNSNKCITESSSSFNNLEEPATRHCEISTSNAAKRARLE